jgi:peptide/nickel transport system substrate-binding protein
VRNLSSPRPLCLPAQAGSNLSALCVKSFCVLLVVANALALVGCSHQANHDSSSLTFLIESNPTNLDPRYATDSYSQRIDGLLFSGLLQRDAQMNLHGDLADTWEIPNPLTYVFHLHPGVRFQDGGPLTSADVKSTFDFILNPVNRSPKRGAFRLVASIDTPDPVTVIFPLKGTLRLLPRQSRPFHNGNRPRQRSH